MTIQELVKVNREELQKGLEAMLQQVVMLEKQLEAMRHAAAMQQGRLDYADQLWQAMELAVDKSE